MIEIVEQYSQLSLFSALLIYALSFIFFAVDLANRAGEDGVSITAATRDGVRRNSKSARIGFSLLVLGWVFQLAATVLRGLEGGRVPWANMYEFALTATLAIVTIFIVVQFFVDLRFLGTLISGLTLVFLGIARMNFYVPSVPLPPALDSYWLVIHIIVAVLAVAFLTLSFGLSIVQLLQSRRERLLKEADSTVRAQQREAGRSAGPGNAVSDSAVSTDSTAETSGSSFGSTAAAGMAATATLSETQSPAASGAPFVDPSAPDTGKQPLRFLRSFPNADTLENLSYRMVVIGFVFWTFTLIAGSIWAEHAWGRYWGWDTKEVWTFIIWVLYAGFIHARATKGWRGSRSAWLSIIAYSAVIFNFTIVNLFFKGLHAYSGL
ncbi:c-type cytochrome biogenesis protein CcsB [Lysinibacter sp. HNR]|uniref:c-type cytochrome biogenesis protein CcsB n=1 Tax=Lysinibacter sp. HNR TaxID=3031408 RepID=UPI002435AA99|nr:c-type cytochrome biogenesis protein CcsB [Lysinibacter sp. HNR]WGD37797.1 c-type cytochrome biogenesis protein CcsB [Lysinibacter sp. HNR]